MRSLQTSIIDPKNAAGLLNWWCIFQMGLERSILHIDMGSVGQKAAKLMKKRILEVWFALCFL